MCDCDVYRAYDRCECDTSTNAGAQVYAKILKESFEKMRIEYEDTCVQLKKQEALYQKQVKKHAKDGKKLAQLQKMVKEYELMSKVEQEQKRHIDMLEKQVKNLTVLIQEKEEEMQGSRMTLRTLNKTLMEQNKMLKIENCNLKNIMNSSLRSSEEKDDVQKLVGDIDWMTKTQLKSVIQKLKEHCNQLEDELENKEKMLNSASLCYSVLREELNKCSGKK